MVPRSSMPVERTAHRGSAEVEAALRLASDAFSGSFTLDSALVDRIEELLPA